MSIRTPRHTLALVGLAAKQQRRALEANPNLQQATFAVLCGSYGQIFGTARQCKPMYETWRRLYLDVLFESAFESHQFAISDYRTTVDLDRVLAEAAPGRPLEVVRKELEAVRKEFERRARRPIRPAPHYDHGHRRPLDDESRMAELARVLQASLGNIERAIDELREVIEDRLTEEPDSS